MLPLLTAAQMRQCDQYTIERLGTPSRTLMERAARAAIDVLKAKIEFNINTRMLVLCGSGNNGGDGFAMARFLLDEGYRVTVYYAGAWSDEQPDVAHMSRECAVQYECWRLAGGSTQRELSVLPKNNALIIDALFGIGLDRPVVGKQADWIEAVNACALPVLAIDIPSGICADSGKVLGHAIRATVTATMAYPKRGLLLYPGASYAASISICDIGIGTEVLFGDDAHDTPTLYQIQAQQLAPLLRRPTYANKGTFGRVLVIGGFPGMSGAPYFAAKSAYRAGAGLVELMSAEANRIPLQTLLPEAVYTAFDPEKLPSDAALGAILDRADAVVLGCGLGQSVPALTLCEQVLRLYRGPMVLDADALNLLALHEALQALVRARTAPTLLTPHLGEASRLCGCSVSEIASDLIATADAIADCYQAVCVLKDARTIVSDGHTQYLQSHGNSGMATGGSGDCLAGLLGSLFAQHRTDTDASPAMRAACGVLIHAMAGDHAAERLGEHAVMASDISDSIGEVLHALTVYGKL